MSSSEIQAAFDVLEKLDQFRGRARKPRIEVLQQNCSNPVLSDILKTTYDWRKTYDIPLVSWKRHNPESWSLEESWVKFIELREKDFLRSSGYLHQKHELQLFVDKAHPTCIRWALRILDGRLLCGIGQQLISHTHPHLHIPNFWVPVLTDPPPGIQVLIFVNEDRSWSAYSDGFRQIKIIDCIAKQFARLSPETVYNGVLASTLDEEFKQLLHNHVQGVPRRLYNAMYYGMKFHLAHAIPFRDYSKRILLEDHTRSVSNVISQLKVHNRRTSISSLKFI